MAADVELELGPLWVEEGGGNTSGSTLAEATSGMAGNSRGWTAGSIRLVEVPSTMVSLVGSPSRTL